MYIDEDRATFAGFRGNSLGFRPSGGGRPALRPRSAPWPGGPTGNERPRRRRTRQPRYRRSADAAGPHGALIRALRARAGADWRLVSNASWPWASGLFVGERHHFVVEGDAGVFDGIKDWAFSIPLHLVADIAIFEGDEGRVTIEALTVVEV